MLRCSTDCLQHTGKDREKGSMADTLMVVQMHASEAIELLEKERERRETQQSPPAPEEEEAAEPPGGEQKNDSNFIWENYVRHVTDSTKLAFSKPGKRFSDPMVRFGIPLHAPPSMQ